jgi:hypothetical protein
LKKNSASWQRIPGSGRTPAFADSQSWPELSCPRLLHRRDKFFSNFIDLFPEGVLIIVYILHLLMIGFAQVNDQSREVGSTFAAFAPMRSQNNIDA